MVSSPITVFSPLGQLLEPLRRSPLSTAEQVLLACQIATWAFLGQDDRLPPEVRPIESPLSGDALARVFERLQRLDRLKGDGDAFLQHSSALASIPEEALDSLQQLAQRLVQQGQIGPSLYADALANLQTYGHIGSNSLPQELVELLVGLAEVQPGDSVYTPYDSTLQISLAVAAAGARPSAELRLFQPMPHIGNLLAGQPTEVRIGDPLEQPAYTAAGSLVQFARSISFLPLGERVPLEAVEGDRYCRFPERTTAGHVLSARHVLAQTEVRSVMLVANSLLFSPGAELGLRRELVESGLRAVIALPPATLYGTNIPLGILVVDRPRAPVTDEVLFIDGSNKRFHRRDGKGRTTLSGWKELLQAARSGLDLAASRVTRTAVAANDYQLMVGRYTRTSELDAVDTALQLGRFVKLEGIVEFIRPAPVVPSTVPAPDAIEVPEVGAVDLRELDYTKRPEKLARLPALKNALQPLDIVIVIKGSVGKVGLIPPELSEPWVASQTCLILRTNARGAGGHTSRSLFMYLRSPLGKACIHRIVSGAAVPLIQLKELRVLPVPVPTREEVHQAEEALHGAVALQLRIQELQQQQALLGARCWALALNTEAA